ncbi:APH(3')-II family aminoglycoside O-phosphotransferase [Luteimonas aquatica]|uniref:APH(3')-II family aminoglycoside O-phosphotransferase n=1 Tax=Luteimonas aquatica TaxID=450364 RepID=UPI001F5ACFF5|nr:APH(3')-II family aminoglycoside O-phosphotransferase [Luteimonas aquatica]
MPQDRIPSPSAAVPASAQAPRAWQAPLAGYRWDRQTIGCSGAAVYRLSAPGRPTLFAKTDLAGPMCELPDEAARLRWFAAKGIACPELLAQARADGHEWLLLGAVPGRDLASVPPGDPQRVVRIAADALRALHRVDAVDCPFDHRLEQRIARAGERLRAGLVDEDDFDEERLGQGGAALFEQVRARRPRDEDLVLTHGDACLPNLMADAAGFTGFVDCGRAGLADRHQDLALAAWSIRHNLGEAWVAPFLARYGGAIDTERLAFYRLLDEFF